MQKDYVVYFCYYWVILLMNNFCTFNSSWIVWVEVYSAVQKKINFQKPLTKQMAFYIKYFNWDTFPRGLKQQRRGFSEDLQTISLFWIFRELWGLFCKSPPLPCKNWNGLAHLMVLIHWRALGLGKGLSWTRSARRGRGGGRRNISGHKKSNRHWSVPEQSTH